jgi:hypothetical protein
MDVDKARINRLFGWLGCCWLAAAGLYAALLLTGGGS